MSSNGFWTISRFEDDVFTNLAGGPNPPEVEHDFGKDPKGVRVRFNCVGGTDGGSPTLTLYVNGERIGEAVDPEGASPGAAGVVVNSVVRDSGGGRGNSWAFFDDFVIRAP